MMADLYAGVEDDLSMFGPLADDHVPLAVPGVVTTTGYALPPDLSYEGWEAIGRSLSRAYRSLLFVIGDWLVYGEDHYGERYAQAVEATGAALHTLQNAASVCRAIPPSRRREGLSFSAHAELASVMRAEPEAGARILDAAAAQGLSSRQVRDAVATYKREAGLVPLPPYRPETVPCPACNGSGRVPADEAVS